ncbi:MAG: phosphate ABC transporter substrate-binding protein [bacterium]|nr:phosphate ABC transporter substrate-binding protein [bacterium]
MKYRICSLMAAIVLVSAMAVQAGNVVVIVNPASSISETTASEVSKVFMGKSGSVGGADVAAVDQAPGSQARIDFSEKILGRSVKKVTDYWKKRTFSGKGEAPQQVANDAKVIAFVADNPGAIGYVSAGAVTDKVKTVTVDGKTEW